MSNARYNLSAANVSIELPIGRPIGNIQNLTLNISHNQQQIKNLHNNHIQGFVKGFTVNSASASRAIIDYETFFGDNNDISEYFGGVDSLAKTAFSQVLTSANQEINVAGVESPIPIQNIANGIGNWMIKDGNTIDVRETLELFEKLAIGELSLADLFGYVEFNLVAKGEVELWRLQGCVLQSRSIRIDTSELIIMENIEILAKKFIDTGLNIKI